MTGQLKIIIRAISKDIVEAARRIMASDIGINQKTKPPKNTLVGSNLYKQIKRSWKEDGDNIVIDTFFNDYIGYIEWDRPPKHKKRPPTREIVKWLQRKHIVSSNENINSVAYVISRSIWEKGWKGRKILEALDKYVDSGFENKYADMIFDALFKEVDDYFSD